MKLNMRNSKKGNQLLRNLKPTARRVVWISSSMILMLTLGLILTFNLSDSPETIAAASIDEQCITYEKTNHAGMTSESKPCAGNQPAPDETKHNEPSEEAKIAAESNVQDHITTEPISSNSEAEELKNFKTPLNRNRTDANDITELNIVSFGPNPFKEKLSLTFNQQVDFDVDFEIINASGMAVFIDIINAHAGLNHCEFTDRMGLPPGTYYMTLLYNHKKQVKKLIKN